MIHLPYSSDHVNLMFRKLLSTEIGIYCRSFFLSFENMMRTVLQNLCYALFTRKCDAILLCMIYVIEQIIFCNLCPFACRNLMVNKPLIICGGWCPVFSILIPLPQQLNWFSVVKPKVHISSTLNHLNLYCNNSKLFRPTEMLHPILEI